MRVMWRTVVALGLTAGVARAQLAAPQQAVDPGSGRSRALTSQAAEALVRSKPADALQMANKAIAADARNPWGHYDRASALVDLGRVDDAVAEFKAAQQSFSAEDAWGKSIAIYGRANALAQAGRCSEAQPVFEEYAVFVERADASAADMARRYAKNCQQRR